MHKLVMAVALVTFVAGAAEAGDKVKETARGAARTTADAVVDGGRTVGRTTKALFKGGSADAKKTLQRESKATGDEVKADGRATRAAAHDGK